MRLKFSLGAVSVSVLAGLVVGRAQIGQKNSRLNPMIALHEKGLPVFGVTHPAIVVGQRGGRGGNQGAATPATDGSATPVPPPQPSLADVARETMAYKMSDFEYD